MKLFYRIFCYLIRPSEEYLHDAVTAASALGKLLETRHGAGDGAAQFWDWRPDWRLEVSHSLCRGHTWKYKITTE